MKKRKRLLFLCLAALLLMTSCGKSKTALPETYEVSDTGLSSLTAVLGDTASKAELTASQTPTETDATASYSYDKLTSGAAAAKAYADYLTGSNVGFKADTQSGTVDETSETGEATLTKTGDTASVKAQIAWTASGCQITLTVVSVEETATDPMTNEDAVAYLKSLSPAALGLSGSSMSGYAIYPMDSIAKVDDVPCLKLQVYEEHRPENSNHLVGIYLLTADQKHLYKLEGRGSVSELTVS